MIFPVLKKEIHLRLIKRLLIICLLSALVALTGAIYLEYKRLGPALLSNAEKESMLFSSFYSLHHAQPADFDLNALKTSLAANLRRTSFIHLTIFDQNRELLFELSRENGAAITQSFSNRGVEPLLSDTPHSTWLYSSKRLYARIALPLHSSGSEQIIGYLSGSYRLSVPDMQALAGRFLITALAVLGGIILCSCLLYPAMIMLHSHLIRNSKDLNRANSFLLKNLGAALAKCDHGSITHNHRVVIFSIRLAEKAGLSNLDIRNLLMGAYLHDIGMLDVSETITRKTDTLEESERGAMEKHVKTGITKTKRYRWLKGATPIIRYHHEKYQGTGYPAGTAHEKIPLIARVFAIADCFEALTADRPHRQAHTVGEALEIMEEQSGLHFDPVLLAAFVEIAPQLQSALEPLDSAGLEKELHGTVKKYLPL